MDLQEVAGQTSRRSGADFQEVWGEAPPLPQGSKRPPRRMDLKQHEKVGGLPNRSAKGSHALLGLTHSKQAPASLRAPWAPQQHFQESLRASREEGVAHLQQLF